MKTMESSSWNKKWRLKEGNIVNDNKELSLNPTTKNNLNDDLEFTESPTQENPQNLIRYRRSSGDNNQPQSTFVPVDVPGDGSCLFWATTLAYLIPVEDDSAVFAERFKRLFGEEESGNISYIRELIKEYDPFANNVRSDRTFNRLVTRVLRDRVVDYISLRENGYREFITGDFNQYLNNMRDRNSWGGEPEILAMSNMLDASITVDAGGAKDIQHLAARKDAVNDITMEAWKNLEASPYNVVAYAMGLGMIKLDFTKEVCKTKTVVDAEGILIQVKCLNYTAHDKEPGFYRAYSIIDMNRTADTEHLSRVIPNPINNATMICLPRITNADYEKGIIKSVSTAVYYCNNAVAIAHNQRQKLQVNDKFIIYDLKYINSGTIIGSNKL